GDDDVPQIPGADQLRAADRRQPLANRRDVCAGCAVFQLGDVSVLRCAGRDLPPEADQRGESPARQCDARRETAAWDVELHDRRPEDKLGMGGPKLIAMWPQALACGVSESNGHRLKPAAIAPWFRYGP